MSVNPAARHRGDLHEADDGVLRLLRASVVDLSARQADFVLAIHQQILAQLPGATTSLAANGRALAQRLAGALLEAALVDEAADRSARIVRAAGAANQAEGFDTRHYGAVTHVLLHSVRNVYQGEWSSGLSSGWVQYLLWFREQLVVGAERELTARRAAAWEAERLRPSTTDAGASARPGDPGAADARDDDDLDDLDDDLDDDADGPGYGELMVSMTSRRERKRRRSR